MNDEFTAEIAALKARIAALEAQVRWQPVESGFEHVGKNAYGDVRLLRFRVGGLMPPYIAASSLEDDGVCVEVSVPDDLLVCRLTPAADWVDWEKVPPGYDWVAADGNGDLFAYTLAPKRQPAYWSCRSTQLKEVPGTLPLGIDWRQSLRRRPTT